MCVKSLKRVCGRGEGGNIFSIKDYFPCLRSVESADAIEHAGLASAVRAYDGDDLPCADLKTDVVKGFDPSEVKLKWPEHPVESLVQA